MTPRTVGRYEIEELLGHGGMASVHLARQRALGPGSRSRSCTRSTSPTPRSRTPPARVRVAGGLSHPSIVSVIEYFEHEGVPFIAMEYLERGSLRPLVGRLTLAQRGAR